MTRIRFSNRCAQLLFLVSWTAACGTDSTLRPFSSDGCSLFPDNSLISADSWCDCCFNHDMAYWRGGTAAERETADLALRDCVLANTGNAVLATAMYEGVRFGGSPYFYNWYRWGYGWPYERQYQELSAAETDQADRLLAEYLASAAPAVCPR